MYYVSPWLNVDISPDIHLVGARSLQSPDVVFWCCFLVFKVSIGWCMHVTFTSMADSKSYFLFSLYMLVSFSFLYFFIFYFLPTSTFFSFLSILLIYLVHFIFYLFLPPFVHTVTHFFFNVLSV